MPGLSRVLIANRGEIAIRIARAAAGLGMESIAVYDAADQLSLHTRYATRAVQLPAASDPVSAYLNVEAIIDIAKAEACDCIHPGYGFLSENAPLAQACAAAGITFVGPEPETLTLFGDKVSARKLALELEIPVVPGSDSALLDSKAAAGLAAEFGYPVMLKAAAGGGGRGMRAVQGADEMDEAFTRCQSEAEAAFGNGAVFIEKLVIDPQHIEIQVLGDGAEVVHFYERDCSIQQRNQKVVEIAPAPNLDPDLRDKLLDAAITLTRACNYRNAGTVEFLLDPAQGEYYFIECNPRIQVEHTVTEQVMGVDLVESQFRIAAGSSLAALGYSSQADVGTPRGYAIQTRVVAQGAGTITAYKEPSGVGTRVDAHGYAGYTPPPQFDPLLAKLICYSPSPDYQVTLERTARALAEFHIVGLATNLQQLRGILQQASVRKGDARTTLLASLGDDANDTTGNITLDLLSQQARLLQGVQKTVSTLPSNSGLAVPDGEIGVEAPINGNVLQLALSEGQRVAAGDTLVVISAMK
ncbi:MAG: biotin carboxylase N-terminal domain-containing protein, partial [Pseudomonadota bacterium]